MDPAYAEYVVLPDRRLGFVRYVGAIEAQQILRLAGALWADPAWQAEFDLIVDLARARVEVSADARARMKTFFERYPLASRGRLVHVVGSESLQYSRLAESSLPHEPRGFARRSDIPEALSFLFGDQASCVATDLSRAVPARVDMV